MKLLKNFYLKYIETKLSNKITFVIGVILVIQVVMFFVMYSYSYHIRREEIVENNIQILHQVNTNYLAGIIEDIDTASMEIFFNKVFWKKNEESSVNEDDQIYNILASQYHSDNDLNSIYLYSSASNKFYIMDEASFNQIPVKSSASTLYIFNGDDLQKMPWYEAAQENKGLVVSLATEIRHDNQHIICFSRYMKYPLKNNDYYFVISLNLDISKFDTLCHQLNNDSEELMIFNQEKLIYNSGNQPDEVVNDLARAIQKQKEANYWFTTKINSRKYVVIGDRCEDNGWTMLKLVPHNEMNRDVKLQFWTNCLIVIFIFSGGIFCLSYIINRTMKPIENLAETMRHYRQGNCYEKPELSGRLDEVGTLYSSFEKMNVRINMLIESEYQSQIQEKQARLEALQAQLDPHFLYNTLQTISGIAIENNVFEIEDINNSLSEILRYSLNNSKQLVKIEEEVKIVQDYMNIQKYRFGDRLNLKIDLSSSALELRVPVFFLQLPVENAIKHGMEKSVHTVNIHIYDTQTKHIFNIHIEDDGHGVTKERLDEIRTMLRGEDRAEYKEYKPKGLVNLNERIRQQLGPDYGVWIDHMAGGGTQVVLTVPKGGHDAESTNSR